MEVTKENIQTFNAQEKYVIIHSEGSTYNLQNMVLNEDTQTISGTTKHLLIQHSYAEARESKRVHRYKKKKQQPLSEVHFYVKGASFPKMDTEITIPLEHIISVSINNPNSGRSIANVFASSIGVFFALVLIVALTKSSCPFVYIKNGQEYIFTGELYPGVITANMQRDDYLPLPNVEAENGKFELKITNELKEIQYTDLTQLIIVEHDKNVKVLLDKNGNPHSFANLDSPRAVSYDGKRQTLGQIQDKDNDYWSFNSAEKTPNSTREMVLEFDRPKHSDTAKLFMTAKNSVWLDIVFGKFNEQFGSYYNDFQQKQQTLPGHVSEQWIKDQNIPLSIYVETANGWKLMDRISTVGPLAMRDMVIPLNLQNVGDGPIKIKLETGFMFWDVDYVAIDYSSNIDLSPQYIAPSLATDENNYEVTHLLSETDLDYLVQPEIGNEVRVIFDVPEVNESMGQSVFLKNRGYYNYIREYEGAPDLASLKSFREKNAFSEFSESSYLNFVSMDNLMVNYDK
ncbi:hypothetical protein [Flagellimonas myxillae]|uniref:hypothetical protein n=1 Tax=Flagellimonas myxillae TaxID=2942214 RepID=UPI00201EB787|nr:hypothetical protein [Muricauda myxillae]MCL6266927.1 hypothetical protein [Muricauda myxillae]